MDRRLRSRLRRSAHAAFLFMATILLLSACSPGATAQPPPTTPVILPTVAVPTAEPTMALRSPPSTRDGGPSPPYVSFAAATPERVEALATEPTPTAEQVTNPLQSVQSEFSGERALAHVEYLANVVGSRPAGSPARARAAEYLASQFAASGLPVEQQSFRFTAFDDRGASFSTDSPTPRSIQAQTLSYSAAGDVQAELTNVGLGRQGDYEPGQVRGRLALAQRGEIKFAEKVANLAADGAVGVLIYNNAPGSFAGSLASVSAVPAASLSQSDGQQLVDTLRGGSVQARLTIEASTQERLGANLIASTAPASKTVVIGGHYDSVSAGPGANDNGSGTASLLELARVIAAHGYPFSVRFIAFDAEEIGLVGSANYVRQLDQFERGRILAMINLDMVGVGDRLAFGGDSDLVELAMNRASELGESSGRLRGVGIGLGSDHASFEAVGIPALFLYRSDDPRYHTAEDRAEYVQAENLQTAGRIVLKVLDEFAQQSR